jgi:hypothetical protein
VILTSRLKRFDCIVFIFIISRIMWGNKVIGSIITVISTQKMILGSQISATFLPKLVI